MRNSTFRPRSLSLSLSHTHTHTHTHAHTHEHTHTHTHTPIHTVGVVLKVRWHKQDGRDQEPDGNRKADAP
jgi:hypothetical protein